MLFTKAVLLSVVVFALFTLQTYAFYGSAVGCTSCLRSQSLNMMFNFGKKAADSKKKGVEVTIDSKVLTSTEPSVNLRKFLMANGVDVYPLKAKITGNCGGAGICGTCAVKVLSGAENLNPPSKNEQNTLKNKPQDFRLSCCSRVTGPITIKTKP